MDNVTIFWMQLFTSVFVFGIVAVWYVWPYLTRLSRNSALIPLLFVHVPRYVGMTLLVAGMVDPKLPRAFRSSAAYGDLLEAALAFASIFALRGNWRIAVPLVWVGQHVGIRGPAKRSTRRPAVERAELQPSHPLVCLYVLRSLGNRFAFDDLLDFCSSIGLGINRVSGSVGGSFIGPCIFVSIQPGTTHHGHSKRNRR